MHVSRQYSTVTNGRGGGGGLSSIVDTMASVYIYIVCSTIFVSHSNCRLASTSMIQKYIKLLLLKTINYALHLESTSLKVHVYHIIELFIYAFPIYCENLICVCCSENKVINLFTNNKSLFLINCNVLLTLIRWSRSVVRLVIGRHH